ncbi:MAG: DUF1015 domain-containing protein [Saprospiraceae bacterium]|nr:DUF1015 domain-containing protein [Saprospiraceae bacterium]
MQIKPFRVVYPQPQRIPFPDAYCAEAKNRFLDYQREQLLAQAPEKALYVYQIEEGHRRHTGLVALNAVGDFLSEKIKKHEKTLSAREKQHTELLLNWQAMLKPVLLTYPSVPEIAGWLQAFTQANQPFLELHFKDDHQTHRVWQATAPTDVQHLQTLFARHVNGVYIADGHHRSTTMALLHEHHQHRYPQLDFDHLFCAFFATDQLDILDYNRVVEGLNGHSPAVFLEKLARVFVLERIENPRKPRRKFELKMFFQEQWYRLHWKPEVLSAVRPEAHALPVLLDVSLLNELVLHELLGIGDVRTNARINYVEGTKGLKGVRKAVRAGAARVGFVLHPVRFDDMMHIADAGESLPPKSTFFAPRLKSGVLVQLLGKE